MTAYAITGTEKRDIFLNGKCVSIKIKPMIWQRFITLAVAKKMQNNALAAIAQRECNGTLAEAIEAYVRKHDDRPLFLAPSRDTWLGGIVDAMRAKFEGVGYPLPEKIRATVGFPSTGMRGKRRGECWAASRSADGHTEIFIHPVVSDPVMIVNILTHELVHAAQDQLNGKINHGKSFKKICDLVDITEGKGTHALGGKAWKVWAMPIIEAAGPMPHSALTEAARKEKKQTTRQLKCECPECGTIWRMSKKAMTDIAAKAEKAGQVAAWLRCTDPLCDGIVLLDADELGDNEDGEEMLLPKGHPLREAEEASVKRGKRFRQRAE